jgi:cytochrome c oxidase subunit 3
MRDELTLEQEFIAARKKSAKPMMWIAMLSMTMLFLGLVSAVIISKNREDWVSFILPPALYTSTLLILFSSISFYMAKRFVQKNNYAIGTVLLLLTLSLGIAFVYFQYLGFKELQDAGIYLTGKGSLVASSLLMVISFAHVLHVFGGLIVLFVVIYNHFKQRYNSEEILGLELGELYWHFVDVLWICLFLFFYFIRE